MCKGGLADYGCEKAHTLIELSISQKYFLHNSVEYMSRNVRKRTFSHVCLTKIQITAKSACTSSQTDQSFYYSYGVTLHHWLSKMRPMKILIRQCNCEGAHVHGYVFWPCSIKQPISRNYQIKKGFLLSLVGYVLWLWFFLDIFYTILYYTILYICIIFWPWHDFSLVFYVSVCCRYSLEAPHGSLLTNTCKICFCEEIRKNIM